MCTVLVTSSRDVVGTRSTRSQKKVRISNQTGHPPSPPVQGACWPHSEQGQTADHRSSASACPFLSSLQVSLEGWTRALEPLHANRHSWAVWIQLLQLGPGWYCCQSQCMTTTVGPLPPWKGPSSKGEKQRARARRDRVQREAAAASRATLPAIPCFSACSLLLQVETFFIPRKMFVVQTFCLLYLMLATVFNCAMWQAPCNIIWIWIVCFALSFQVKITPNMCHSGKGFPWLWAFARADGPNFGSGWQLGGWGPGINCGR